MVENQWQISLLGSSFAIGGAKDTLCKLSALRQRRDDLLANLSARKRRWQSVAVRIQVALIALRFSHPYVRHSFQKADATVDFGSGFARV
jgi:hypothetical protein